MATAGTAVSTPPTGPAIVPVAPPSGEEAAEVRARQQAAVLAFGRRADARPSLNVLTQDAVALVAEVLQADLSGASEVVDAGNALSLRIVSSPLDVKPAEPALCD